MLLGDKVPKHHETLPYAAPACGNEGKGPGPRRKPGRFARMLCDVCFFHFAQSAIAFLLPGSTSELATALHLDCS